MYHRGRLHRPPTTKKSTTGSTASGIYQADDGKVAPQPTEVRYVTVDGKQYRTTRTTRSTTRARWSRRSPQIVQKMGQYLNAPNWVATVNSFGPIMNRGGGPYASLRQGKYDFDDTFQLQQFDSALPPNGNWKALGATRTSRTDSRRSLLNEFVHVHPPAPAGHARRDDRRRRGDAAAARSNGAPAHDPTDEAARRRRASRRTRRSAGASLRPRSRSAS